MVTMMPGCSLLAVSWQWLCDMREKLLDMDTVLDVILEACLRLHSNNVNGYLSFKNISTIESQSDLASSRVDLSVVNSYWVAVISLEDDFIWHAPSYLSPARGLRLAMTDTPPKDATRAYDTA